MSERAIRSIAVVGDGIVGLSAALAFRRALGDAAVTLVGAERDEAALADRMPTTLPEVHGFHALIGIDEGELVRRGVAVHHLGTRFEGWSADGEAWFHAFRSTGDHAGKTAIHHHWAAARDQGEVGPYHRYSAAGVLAEAGKFVHPAPDATSPLGTHRYGLRVDPVAYERLLRERASAAGIANAGERMTGVELRPDGGVAAVLLDSGKRLEADLYLDCAGPTARLLGRVSNAFESWSAWFPFDRLLAGSERSLERPSPTERVRADASGWTVEQPLADRVLVRRLQRGDVGMPLRFGCRTPFVRNVLALGDAAVAIDPLYGLNLHLAQSGIMRAIELLPGRDCHPLETREYNRQAADEWRRARDFVALHYLRTGRSDGEGWMQGRAAVPPVSLARTLDQFEERGRLPFFEEETFTSESWVMALLGLGVRPRAQDAESLKVPAVQAVQALDRRAAELQAVVGRLPSYADYLARMRAAGA